MANMLTFSSTKLQYIPADDEPKKTSKYFKNKKEMSDR